MEEEEGRAAIWEVDAATGSHRVFASGLRNPVGMAWEPESGTLWTAVNERDEFGSDLPFRRGMFVGQHGSWNRKPRSGYKVVFVPFTGGKPNGEPIFIWRVTPAGGAAASSP